MTEQRVVVTAGHVDHGKSTLVRALTGTDPDRLLEERRRGLSIELGFAWCQLPAPRSALGRTAAPVTAAFVDVPGHERFVGTMLAGAGPAPAALLVVAADDGWSAQTEEHLEVLDLLAVPGLAVAVTKVDLVEPTRVEQVAREVADRVAGTTLAGAPVVSVDATRGLGVDEVAATLARRLAATAPATDLGRPRLWVDRAFAVRGAGTVVTGTLRDGAVAVGDSVRVLPRGVEVRVREVQTLGRPVDRAAPGTRVALNLVGVDHDEVDRGDAVVGGGPWRTTSRVDAVVRALPGRRIERTGAWQVHVGSAAVPARVLPLTDPIEPGAEGAVRLLLDAPLPLVAGDRLVLREAGRRRTIGGGQVVDPDTGPPPRGRAAREGRVRALLHAAEPGEGPQGERSAAERLRALLRLSGGARPGASVLAAAGLRGDGPRPEGVVALGGSAVLASALARWAEAVVAGTAVRGSGGSGGPVAREQLVAAATAAGAPRAVAEALPDHLVGEGRLVRTAGGYVDAERASDADLARRRRATELVAALAATPFAPPELTETARRIGVDHREVNRLVQSGEVVRAGTVAFAAEAVAAAVDRLADLQARNGPFTAAEAKAAWGTTRRYAIPLLEHLDSARITTFDGHRRTLTGRRPPERPGTAASDHPAR